jgi:hypothetical protein
MLLELCCRATLFQPYIVPDVNRASSLSFGLYVKHLPRAECGLFWVPLVAVASKVKSCRKQINVAKWTAVIRQFITFTLELSFVPDAAVMCWLFSVNCNWTLFFLEMPLQILVLHMPVHMWRVTLSANALLFSCFNSRSPALWHNKFYNWNLFGYGVSKNAFCSKILPFIPSAARCNQPRDVISRAM